MVGWRCRSRTPSRSMKYVLLKIYIHNMIMTLNNLYNDLLIQLLLLLYKLLFIHGECTALLL